MAQPYQRLRGLIKANGDNHTDAAHAILLSDAAFSRKICAKMAWTSDEMYGLMDRYNVPYKKLSKIFPKMGRNEE